MMAIEEAMGEGRQEAEAGMREAENGKATDDEQERLSQMVWEELKERHVQFFAGVCERLWAEAG